MAASLPPSLPPSHHFMPESAVLVEGEEEEEEEGRQRRAGRSSSCSCRMGRKEGTIKKKRGHATVRLPSITPSLPLSLFPLTHPFFPPCLTTDLLLLPPRTYGRPYYPLPPSLPPSLPPPRRAVELLVD